MKPIGKLRITLLSVLLAVVVALAGACASSTAPAPTVVPAKGSAPTAAPAKAAVSQFEVLRAAADTYLASDKAKTPNISAEDLYLRINDDDKANDPFILSVRSAQDYAKGHVPGAVNIPWREVFKKENLAKLPKDKQIVVYCYTGHTGSQVTALLNAAGYNAINLKFGMTSWTKDVEVASGRFDNGKDAKDYKVETKANEAAAKDDFPIVNVTTSTESFDIVATAADTYLASDKAKTPNISAEDLYLRINDDDKANDPFILSVRSAQDYAKGHVPGAVNIPWREVFKKENLAKLPKDKQIVVYCYTGHTGSQVTALLNAAGYNAINLKFGMTSWTKDVEIAPQRFDNSKDAKDYKLVTGNQPL